MLLQTRRFELEVAHGHIFARLSGWGEVLLILRKLHPSEQRLMVSREGARMEWASESAQ